jgi:hypothetical protein
MMERSSVSLVAPVANMMYGGSAGSQGIAVDSYNGGDVAVGKTMMGKPVSGIMPPVPQAAPHVVPGNRMTIQESSLSLLVDDVSRVAKQVMDTAVQSGGYLVSSSVSRPTEGGNAFVIVRVPVEQLDNVRSTLKSFSVRVIDENLTGRDVTDQYIDIDERIMQLNESKAALVGIKKTAKEVSDIIAVTQQIQSLQDQIDSLKGQQQSLSQNASLAKIAVTLTTDDLSLPYAPKNVFRPEVVFKMATRSLIGHAQKLAEMAIWLGVYAVVWVPVLCVGFVLLKQWKRK